MINFKKINIKSRLSNLPAYFFVVLIFLFAGALSFVLSKNITPIKSPVTGAKKIRVVKKSNISPTPITEDEIKNEEEEANTNSGSKDDKTSYTVITTSAPIPTTYSTSTTTTNQTTSTQNNTTESKVNVSVTGAGSFDVKINDSSNQCDVLTKALEQGKIQSLNMRYDNSLGSNAVYQINGVGKDNSVWWTYKVNGQAPNQGCSYIKANNGDNIEWKYIGS